MKTAVIDIGTNTMLLLIADLEPRTLQIKTVLDTIKLPRLGKGVDANRIISTESMNKAILCINDYKKIIDEYGTKRILATGTSFVRDARNSAGFIDTIYKNSGVEIEILSGEEEARWSFWGSLAYPINLETKSKYICIIDIGGGSTEISYGKIFGYIDKEIISNTKLITNSLDIGSVRLLEKFFQTQQFGHAALTDAYKFIESELTGVALPDDDIYFIGVAGTVTTLACFKLGLRKYDAKKIEGVRISYVEVENILNRLSKMDREELTGLGDFMQGREDIIIPGIMILKSFMNKFKIKKVITSTRGLRYGILIREAFRQH